MKNVTNFLRVLMVLLITAFVGVTQAQTPFPLIQQGFNQASAPSGWTTQVVSGTAAALTFVTAGTYPTCSPYEGTHMVKFNSFSASAGQSARLYTQTLSTNLTNLTVNFNLYRSVSVFSANDYVQVQYSLNGTTWVNAGTPAYQSDGSTGWKAHNVTLPAAVNNQPTLYIGFLFVSDYGDNCYFDMVTVMATPPAPSPVAGNVTIGTGTNTSCGYPYYTLYEDARTQLLYTAADIMAGGGVAGNISALGFNIVSRNATPMSGFNIRVQQTAATSIATWVTAGWTTVYTGTYTVPATGWQMINFTTPFNWNGTSNVLVEICWNNTIWSGNSTVYNAYGATTNVVNYHTDGDAGCSLTSTSTSYYYPNIRFTMAMAATGFGHLTGVLTSSLDGTPISGATVSVGTNNATTAANGSYMLLNVPIGTQTVTATKLGYYPGTFSTSVIQNQLTTFNMTLAPQPADLTGIVTNGVDGIPIFGAKITAGAFTAYSLEDGSYSVTVMPSGSYTVTCSKPGWDQVTATQVINFPSSTRNFQLFETANPMRNLTATLNAGATAVDLSWLRPTGFYEIIYDDGVQENFTVWATGGNFNALKFTPLMYPATVIGGRVNIGTAMDYPGGTLPTAPFQMAVYNATGANGYPGQQIGGLADVTIDRFGWIQFMFPAAISIPSGNFYLVMIQGGNPPAAAGVAIDETDPQLRSYSRFITGGGPWLPAAGNFMMRAILGGSGGPLDGDLMPSTEKITASAIPGAIYQHTPATVTGTEGVGTFQAFNWSTFNPSNVVKEAISGNTNSNQPLNEICSDPQTAVEGGFGIPLEVTDAVLYNNGPLVNGAGQGPGGSDLSIVEAPLIYTGFNFNQALPYTVADDFTVTGNTWNVTSMDFFGYQTNSTTTSTFTGVFAQIWNGVPGATGSTVVWGDLTTNLMASTSWTNIYRTGVTVSTARPVMKIVANTPGLSLAPGTYWVEWGTTGTLASGPWAPPVTISGQTTTGNALQKASSGTFDPLYGDATTAYPQGLAFLINGSTESSGNMTYQLWRLKQGFEGQPATWVSLGITNSTTMADNGWPSLACGPYRWAGKVIYAGNRPSAATFSNGIGKCWTGSITVNVALTCDSNDVAGTTVQLVNLDYDSTYTAVLTSTGTVTFPTAYLGNYELTVSKAGYTSYVANYLIMADMTIDVMLMQIPFAPSNMFVDDKTLVCTWSPPIGRDVLFQETFTGGFTPNQWVPSVANWYNYATLGNPAPSARCSWTPSASNYSWTLTSKTFTGPGTGSALKLSYDINLDNFTTTTQNEHMTIEISTGTTWVALKDWHSGADIPWTTDVIDISSYAGSSFKIRFNAHGASSFAFDYWYIDNVEIYQEIDLSGCLLAYNVYLNNVLSGVTMDTTYTIPGSEVTYGETYDACVKAVYASGYSDPSCFTFTSTWLCPPDSLAVEAVECSAYLTWDKPNCVAGGCTPEYFEYDNGVMANGLSINAGNQIKLGNFFPLDPSTSGLIQSVDMYFSTTPGTVSAQNCIIYFYDAAETLIGTSDPFLNTAPAYPSGAWVTVPIADIPFTGPIYMMVDYYVASLPGKNWFAWDNVTPQVLSTGLAWSSVNGVFAPMIITWPAYAPRATWLQRATLCISGKKGPEVVTFDPSTMSISQVGTPVPGAAIDLGANQSVAANGEPAGISQTDAVAGLVGYRVYRDGGYLAEVLDPDMTEYYDFTVDPGTHNYSVSAYYDLTSYGFPGMFDESYLVDPVDVTVECGRDLPFCESWEQANFAYNDWTFGLSGQGNWSTTVAIGNPAPSADFGWAPILSDYSYSLESQYLNAGPWLCADIWLDYDIKLVDRNATGDEKLLVEVMWDGTWHPIDEYSNEGSFGWDSYHNDISDGAGKAIKVRFVAEGVNSDDILHWYVDNICVYVVCHPVQDLEADVAGDGITLTWSPPACSSSGPSGVLVQLMQHDGNPVNGYFQAYDNVYGVVYDLAAYPDATLAAIDFHHASWGVFGTWDYMIHVVDWDTYTEIDAIGPLQTTGNDKWELNIPLGLIGGYGGGMVGIMLEPMSNSPTDAYPDFSGDDVGPDGVSLYGPLPDFSGLSTSGIGDFLQNLWIITSYDDGAIVSAPKVITAGSLQMPSHLPGATNVPTTLTLNQHSQVLSQIDNTDQSVVGYSVWRLSPNAVAFENLTPTPITDTTYLDSPIAEDGLYQYYVTTMFEEGTCESISDTVDALWVGINNLTAGSIMIFPNPATEIVNVKSDFTILDIEVMNFLGQSVYTQRGVDMKTSKINVSNLQSGVYFVKVTTQEGVRAVKITVTH